MARREVTSRTKECRLTEFAPDMCASGQWTCARAAVKASFDCPVLQGFGACAMQHIDVAVFLV
ncbi:hypothetical protein [Celeribacter halophilus]|uniref:hypothetical protein n=1 Tax=Celeribacter halophilus TaxID=576117 RepID=UPI002FD73F2B